MAHLMNRIREGLRATLDKAQLKENDASMLRHSTNMGEGAHTKFTFRESDGSLVSIGSIVGMAAIHKAYISGALSEEQCAVVDRHLIYHRRDRSTFDAQTELFEEQVADWIQKNRPHAIREIRESTDTSEEDFIAISELD